ncbi:MAG: hypothetical protein KA766_15300 [Piscinibacter sp.]|uniref:hypothetical protein n=1 Tax=Piscinibacter sp. TaxID=1903157 RepID=UPI001B3F15D6|nr:hypothetical protein [Piscinibacter sp.]MBP5991368.1 hypothetical protein [Piscinibacter sp.]MBP6028672.1 hypothetical protein [Piscinibacter sp.]
MLRTIPLVVLLAACASTKWSNSSKSQQDFYRENSQCMAMAGSGQAQPMMPGAGVVQSGYNQGVAIGAAANQRAIYEQCMMGNGWYKQ